MKLILTKKTAKQFCVLLCRLQMWTVGVHFAFFELIKDLPFQISGDYHQRTHWRLKNMRKGTIFGILALVALGLVVSTAAVSAYGRMGMGSDQSEEMQAAIDAGDYSAWQSMKQERITQENFDQIRARGQGRMQNQESREEIQAALEAGDYETWKSLVESLDRYPVDVETFTEDDFNTLVEMHNARVAGDFETAQELADQIGFENQGMGGMNKGNAHMAQGQGRGQGFSGDCPYA